MKNKLTAVIITGTPEEVSSLINASFSNMVTVSFPPEDSKIAKEPDDSMIKYKYYRPTSNYNFSKNLNKKQAKVVKKYLSKNISFNFSDLRNYVNSNLADNKVTNSSLSSFLTTQNYGRYQYVNQDFTTYYIWEKDSV